MTLAIPTTWRDQSVRHLRPESDVKQTFEIDYTTRLLEHEDNQIAIVVRACRDIRTDAGGWKRLREDLYYELTLTIGEYGDARGELESAMVVGKQLGDEGWEHHAPKPAWPALQRWLESDSEVAETVSRVWCRMLDIWAAERGEP